MKLLPIIFSSLFILTACSKDTDSSTSSNSTKTNSSEKVEQAAPVKVIQKKIAPEDNPALTGTPVLGFKLQDSTEESVKDRVHNFTIDGVSFAGGAYMYNDGSGFDLADLNYTGYGFDKEHKLQYVGMNFDGRHDKKGVYNRVVSYIDQRGYKVVRKVDPFVGDRLTEYSTPNGDIITVSAPHLSFDVGVEYVSPTFMKMRSDAKAQTKETTAKKEAVNF